MKPLDRYIRNTLSYFSYFSYAPTLAELHTFLEVSSTVNDLKKSLKTMEKGGKITEIDGLYTLGEYSTNIDRTVQKRIISYKKKFIGNRYVKFISSFDFIQFIALTGSVAMDNAIKKDDIDLFVVAKAKRMWITRLWCLVVAELLGVRRKRLSGTAPDKVCLNLFFDERDLEVPELKKTFYVAHELLQMKPLLNRNNTYKALLRQNSWVLKIFPNASKYYNINDKKASKSIKIQKMKPSLFIDIVEQLARAFQLYFINRHKTKERISKTQLWFYPHDFEAKLPKRRKIA